MGPSKSKLDKAAPWITAVCSGALIGAAAWLYFSLNVAPVHADAGDATQSRLAHACTQLYELNHQLGGKLAAPLGILPNEDDVLPALRPLHETVC